MKNQNIVKWFLPVAVMLAAAVTNVACDDDDDGTSGNEATGISVDGKSEAGLTFPAEGGESRVIVSCDGDWTLNYEEDWFEVSISPRTVTGKQTLTVRTSLNGVSPREARLELVASEKYKAELTIQQGGAEKDFRTVGQLREMYTTYGGDPIEGELWVNASVISNFRSEADGGLDNSGGHSVIVVSDGSYGIEILLEDGDSEYALGDEVTIGLRGQRLAANSAGVLQIRGERGGLTSANIQKIGTKTIDPVEVTITEAMSGRYESMYVSFAKVQVAEADRAHSFVMDGADTNTLFEDPAGNMFYVVTGRGATFGDITVPDGSGTIKGIYNTYDGEGELVLTSSGDYSGLNQARFRSRYDPKQFNITPSSMFVSQWAGNNQIEIITEDDVQWSVTSSNAGVFTVSPSSGTGPQMVTVSYSENTSASVARSSVITFITGDEAVPSAERVKASVITQSVVKTFSISRYEVRVANVSTNTAFTINCTGVVNWTAECDNADFVLSRTSGQGTIENSVSFDINYTQEEKVATVTVSTTDEDVPAPDRVHKLVITQSKGATFVVTPMEITVDGNAGEYVISASGWWDATGSDPDNFWLTYWTASTSATLKYTANPSTTQSRTATITFTSQSDAILPENKVKIVTITQKPRVASSYGEGGKPGEVEYKPGDNYIEF